MVSAAAVVAVIRRVVWPWLVFDLKVNGVLDHPVLMAFSRHCYFVVDGWDPDCAVVVALVLVVQLLVVERV